MHNDFVVVGPASDPAGVRTAKGAVEAFHRLGTGNAPFVSRGDESGTHQKEKALWAGAGVQPAGRWYVQTGRLTRSDAVLSRPTTVVFDADARKTPFQSSMLRRVPRSTGRDGRPGGRPSSV
jgi:hypothetical protein